MLTKIARKENARSARRPDIRVNVVSPGSIDTRRDHPEWYQGRLPSAAGIPLGRHGSVDEIAATCLFLVSEDGGQTIHVFELYFLCYHVIAKEAFFNATAADLPPLFYFLPTGTGIPASFTLTAPR